VLLAALVARGRTSGHEGWTRAALAAGIMLAPAILGGTEVYLENPDHAGTAVPVLLLLLLISHPRGHPRGHPPARVGRWWRPTAACALLALAQLGDQLTLITATAPLAAACALPLVSRRASPTPADHRQEERRDDVTLLAAAIASAVLAKLAAPFIRALGGFDLRPLAGITLAPLNQLPARTAALWQALLLLFGASQPGIPRQPQTIRAHNYLVLLADLHLIGLALAAVALAAGGYLLLVRQADRVTAVLVTAICLLLAAALFTTALRSLSNAHEVAPLLPLAAALAGRVLPVPWPPRVRPAAWHPADRPANCPANCPAGWHRARRRAALPALIVSTWLALNLAGLCYAATWPAAQQSQQPVAAWLTAHHQQAGLSGYWQASATTLASGAQVTVAPVIVQPGRAAGTSEPRPQAEADRWESAASWYQPGTREATFVIAVADPAAPGGGLPVAAARACFGQPAAEHRIGQDVIMLYRYNLLTRVGDAAFPGAQR